MTEEEAEAFKVEIARIGREGSSNNRSKLAEMAEANTSGNGVMPNGQDKPK